MDLACGSGRLLPQLLDAGLEVAGLDLAPAMLERARRRLGKGLARWNWFGDMRGFSFGQPFDTILIPYCSLIYMHSDADRLAVFQRCSQHLREGGWLAFDFLAGAVEVGEEFLPGPAGHPPFTEELLVSVVQIKGLARDLRLLNQINYILPKEPKPAQVTVFASRKRWFSLSIWRT